MPGLSVVIPTCNRRESLRITLEGLARQTVPMDSFEVIVVSDGSTDGTDDMLARLTSKLPYALRTLTQANAGPSAARNRGVREASGDIIVFLDDDVEPVPAYLARHQSHHDGDEHVAVLGRMSPDPARCAIEPVWIAWEHAKLQEIYHMFLPGGTHCMDKAGPMHFYSGNASLRRRWILDVGGFDEKFTRQEDVELAVRLARDCGVWFQFDMEADGIHRPTRTFQSWANIPAAYGKLDAQRVMDGTLRHDHMTTIEGRRHGLTRAISNVCRVAPPLTPPVSGTLKCASMMLYRLGAKTAAIAALSAMYNLTYSQQFHRALGEMHWQVPHPAHR